MKAGSLVLLATLSSMASPQQLYRQRVIDHFSHRPAQVELVTIVTIVTPADPCPGGQI